MTRDQKGLLAAVDRLTRAPADDRRYVVRRLSVPQRRALLEFWPAWLHGGQAPPAGDWAVWLMMTGRGFGKTRAGAEWVSALARADGGLRIALVGATIEDALRVMVTGVSGVMRVARTGETVTLVKSERLVRFPSGAEARLFSGADPEKLRGPEHHVAWCDEIAKWRHPQATWDNLQLGLRLAPAAGSGLGGMPRTLVTTTPGAVPLLVRLEQTAAVTRGRSRDNPHVSPAWVARMEAEYRGTRKGREELDGELIGEAEGALWSRALIEACRGAAFAGPEGAEGGRHFRRIAIGVDPPASAQGDACGIVACAVAMDGVCHVIGDHSVRGLSPEGWAGKVADAATAWGADLVVVEANQGGDMAMSVLKARDAALPVRKVFARYGKGDRAEPVAMLFETGQAGVAGSFPELEDELCAMTRGGGYAGAGRSPDRADAMVWAMSALMLGGKGEARVSLV
ncbi:terminase family protein [Sphingomonas sp. LB-2]|uniref:phage terminase large subunit family protein n=1 Tax=Sphingomonas caeni TaxID=2984949 RepID=UPI0022320D75|nr:terminase family protein [Sphingomonas caeni]MCW3848901.1 terminase family protein [Sphingomonas caeni]